MVLLASFTLSALLACSTILAAPLSTRKAKASPIDAPLVNSTGVVAQPNVTSIDNSTVAIQNGTVAAPPDLSNSTTLVNGTDVTATNATTALCDSGLVANSTRKAHPHHKGTKANKDAKKGEKGDVKNKAKHGKAGQHNKGNHTATASGLPPCSSIDNSTVTSVDNTTSVDLNSTSTSIVNSTDPATGAKGAGKKTPPETPAKTEPEKVKAGNLPRGSTWNPLRSSRAPKRRLVPVPLWDAED